MYDRTIAKNPSDLDSILEAFERDDEVSGSADVVDYLPDAADPGYDRIAVELIRVDLERSWARGSRKQVEAYREVAPHLFSDPRRLAEIAFEEYRLRRQSGEPVSAAEYRRKYSIDTSIWPREDGGGIEDDQPSSLSTSRVAAASMLRPPFPRKGDSFAEFDLVEQLGRGAFGVVYRAAQSDLAARDVVLKITAPRSVEPQRLARLQHTNIVPLYSIHEHDGLLAICMPYFGRRTLADVVRRGKTALEKAEASTLVDGAVETVPAGAHQGNENVPPVPDRESSPRDAMLMEPSDVVKLLRQLADGLAHAHGRGIVHSDLKPANVLLTDDGVPMLLDFNLASDSDSNQKATLLVGGTLPYMAPEHLLATRDGSAIVAASDVYSLGVIGFELLTGQRPFRDYSGDFEQTIDQLVADRKQGARTVRSLNPRVTAGLSSIVAHCLEFDVSDRYVNATQLAEDLRRHTEDLPLRYAADRALRERSGKWLRRNERGVRWTVAASLVGLLLALSAMYLVRHNRLLDLEAASAFTDFENNAQTALLNLHAPGTEPELHAIGQSAANRALDRFGFVKAGLGSSESLERLSAAHSSAVRRQGVELLYDLASKATNSSDASRSIELNTAALALLPNGSQSRSLLEQRAKLLKLAGDAKAASDTEQQARAAKPDEQDQYFSAVSLLENARYGDAVSAMEQLSNENRQDPLRWLLLGNAYVGVGRLANAEACYTALIALQPNAMAGYLYRGLCRAEQGNYLGAQVDYDEALLLNPVVATTRINRALAFFAQGNFKEAERDTSAAIAAGLSDPRAYFVRALIRDATGQHDAAQSDREHGLTIQPVDDKGWVARGIALLRTEPKRAAQEFEQGIEKYPQSKSLLQNLVHVYGDRLNRPEAALKYADALVELSPNDSRAFASRAVVQARKGDIKAALRDGERAAANHPSALTSLQIACVYSLVSRTKPDETSAAIRYVQRALASDPKLSQRAASDSDLTTLRSNEEFKSIVAAAEKLTEAAPKSMSSSPKSNAENPKPAASTETTQHAS